MADEPLFRYAPRWINDYKPATAYRVALRELAAAIRELTAAHIDTIASEEELDMLTQQTKALTAAVRAAPSGPTRAGFGKLPASTTERAYLDTSPVMGMANPIAPPLKMWVEDETIRASATFGAAYEGPPGYLHGGYLAAMFDDVLGAAQTATGNPGMTASLTVKYRQPAPLEREVLFHGWLESVDGRKIRARATAHVGEVLCAEAEVLFVSVDFVKMLEDAEAGPRSSPG